jgi:DNA-binding HxlR family transcriptional regulator
MDDIFEVPTKSVVEPVPTLEYTTPDPYEAVLAQVGDKGNIKHLKKVMRDRASVRQLSKKTAQVLYIIRMYQYKYLLTPSKNKIVEIGRMDRKTVHKAIKTLAEKGFIELYKHPTNPLRNTIKLPRGVIFPFWDDKQFPPEVFNPTTMKNLNLHTLQSYDSNHR